MLNVKTVATHALCYLCFFVFIGYFSNSPGHTQTPRNHAVIKLSVKHSGQKLGECTVRSEQELQKLPPNMRIAKVCPRERSPLYIELLLDNQVYFKTLAKPSGWKNDGMSSFYKRLVLPAKSYTIAVRMKDHIKAASFKYSHEEHIKLNPQQVLVIDFNNTKKEFEYF